MLCRLAGGWVRDWLLSEDEGGREEATAGKPRGGQGRARREEARLTDNDADARVIQTEVYTENQHK